MGPARESKETHMAAMTGDIVAAYLRANHVQAEDLPSLIEIVFATLRGLSNGSAPAPEERAPAVPVKRSVTADFIICLEDGKKFKSLKRHLRTQYKMTPEEYRLRWSLPHDYPMVAPNYAKARSDLAKRMGLGQSRA
ncbi:MAG TPA: MucR family transcriptional regulator [Caulobacterales bacterium]|jgi:predicted transcriptional regulator|nr:MucR family transcriptional regulator [Caulobacterales bacterium]